MASRSEQPTIDWNAAETVAERLGIRTRSLVAAGDADQAMGWALQMSHEHSGVAAVSYFELAVMLGYRDPEASLDDWSDLLQSVHKIAGVVKAKIADEEAAAKAAAKEAAEKEAAEKEAAEKEARDAELLASVEAELAEVVNIEPAALDDEAS